MKRLIDRLFKTRDDTLQIQLLRDGVPVAGLHADYNGHKASPNFPQKAADATSPRKDH